MSDIDDYAGLVGETKETVEQRDSERGDKTWSYIDTGTYKLRLYSDRNAGRLRLKRDVWIHKINGIGNFICLDDDCQICKIAKRGRDARCDDAYKYESSKHAIIKVYIESFEGSDGKKSEYIKEQEPFHLVMGRWSMIEAMERWIAEMKPADLRSLIEDETAHAIEMRVWLDGKKWKCEFSLAKEKVTKPEWPEDMPELNTIFMDQTEPKFADAPALRKIANEVETMIAGKSSGGGKTQVRDPSNRSGSSGGGKRAADALADDDGPVDPPARSTSSSKGSKESDNDDPPFEPTNKSTSSNKPAATGECPSEDDDLKFGAHPDEPHPDCMSCPIESNCLRQTFQNKKGK